MRVKIENWGPIETCEYDLDKSVVVTYGENNIGKSYAMQLIYLCLKNLMLYAKENLYLSIKPFCFRGMPLKIQREIPPNPIIRKIH